MPLSVHNAKPLILLISMLQSPSPLMFRPFPASSCCVIASCSICSNTDTFTLAQIRSKATCCFSSHNLVTATIATHRSQPLCIQMIVTEVYMHVWVCIDKSWCQFASGWHYKFSCVLLRGCVCVCARAHVHVKGREKEIRKWREKEMTESTETN